jgi:isoleucyl-tRNA synthetase
MARWADFNDVYKTMDLNFMESVWWGFASLYENDMIYRSHKVVAYSYPLQSPLSNSEESQNYKDVTTKTVYVKFNKRGDIYRYNHVPESIYNNFANSNSKGRFINDFLNSYRYSRIGSRDDNYHTQDF